MARTLLYTVQRVLEKLDLDPVNSINDSPDSILVSREAEDTFYDMLTRNEWPERYDLIEVQSVGDINNPTALRLPTDVSKIESVRYDVTTAEDTDQIIRHIEKLSAEEFLTRTYNRSTSDDETTVVQYGDIPLFICTSQMPTYYAVFDNETIIMDAIDIDTESTLQGSKTVVIGSTTPTFLIDDDYEIPLDLKTYPLFLSELTAACSISLNGTQQPEEERRRNRGISRLRREALRTEKLSTDNMFGRDGTGRG